MATQSKHEPLLGTRLTYLLKRALVDLEELHAELLAPVGINGRELAMLLLLNSSDGHDQQAQAQAQQQSQQEAAARLGVDRTTMVGLVDGLAAKGLVSRQPDPQDRRRNILELTEDAKTTLGRALRASDEAERRLLAELDDTDSTQLRTLLTRLTQSDSQPPSSSGGDEQ